MKKIFIFGGPWGPLRQTQGYQISMALRRHHGADKCMTKDNKATQSPEISRQQVQKLTHPPPPPENFVF